MTDQHTQSIALWQKYQNAKTQKEKDDALFELKELARKKDLDLSGLQEDLDSATQSMIDSVDGKVMG